MVMEQAVDYHEEATRKFFVVHPLDDVAKEKLDTTRLGVMPMTRAVQYSLFALRSYLILMVVLVFYHVLDLAGVFSRI
jgi:hypothetical protein